MMMVEEWRHWQAAMEVICVRHKHHHAKKAKDAVEAATNKDGELAKKLHEAAAKVAEKAK